MIRSGEGNELAQTRFHARSSEYPKGQGCSYMYSVRKVLKQLPSCEINHRAQPKATNGDDNLRVTI